MTNTLSATQASQPTDCGSLLVVVAPSGAGKTSLVRHLLAERDGVRLSVSFTTRAPRPGEHNGIDYHFVSEAEFTARRDAGEFLEWALVHGNYYGTSKAWISRQIAEGVDIVLEIDWQGAAQIRRLFPQRGTCAKAERIGQDQAAKTLGRCVQPPVSLQSIGWIVEQPDPDMTQ